MRTRQALSELIEGRLPSLDGRAELVKLATRLIVEEALEAEMPGRARATTTSAAPRPATAIATACGRGG
jgi:hypothetical protein